MSKPLIEIMYEVRHQSLVDNKRGRRWEINAAALTRLLSEQDMPHTEFDTIFGIPVVIVRDDSTDPKFNFIVD